MRDELILGYDIAGEDSKDFSAISTICGACRSIIHTETFTGEEIEIEMPSKCPYCEAEFKRFVEVGL